MKTLLTPFLLIAVAIFSLVLIQRSLARQLEESTQDVPAPALTAPLAEGVIYSYEVLTEWAALAQRQGYQIIWQMEPMGTTLWVWHPTNGQGWVYHLPPQ